MLLPTPEWRAAYVKGGSEVAAAVAAAAERLTERLACTGSGNAAVGRIVGESGGLGMRTRVR